MMLYRSVQLSDIDAVYELAQQSGIGMTTLPKDKKLIGERVRFACASFKKNPKKHGHEYYLFVLEDPKTKKIVGTSAIEATTGIETPFYSYKVSKRTRFCHALNIRSDYEVLSLVNDHQGRSELCTLFLTPEYRKDKNGLVLSKSRFLFMTQNHNRFASKAIAEMRGVSDEAGISPFWENVGKHFFHMPFHKADRLTIATNKQFIADLMPRNPVYVKLLSEDAQKVIGKPHPSTLPAMNILLKEGFRYNNYVDIFDAGPTIEAPVQEIHTVVCAQKRIISNLSDEVSGKEYLLSNSNIDFRATKNTAVFKHNENTCIISKETAKLLKVTVGDPIYIAPLVHEDTCLQA